MVRWIPERSFIAELSAHQICVLRPRSHTLISGIPQYGDALTHIRLTTQDFEEVPPIFTRKIESKSSLCSSGYRPGWGTGELSSRPGDNRGKLDYSKRRAAPTPTLRDPTRTTAPNARILRPSSAFSPCWLSNDGSEMPAVPRRLYPRICGPVGHTAG